MVVITFSRGRDMLIKEQICWLDYIFVSHVQVMSGYYYAAHMGCAIVLQAAHGDNSYTNSSALLNIQLQSM
jgi:hypothetical protein